MLIKNDMYPRTDWVVGIAVVTHAIVWFSAYKALLDEPAVAP